MSELFLRNICNVENQIKALNSKYNIDNPKKLSVTGSWWLSCCQEIVYEMCYQELNSCIFKIFTYSVMNRVYTKVLGTDLNIQYCKLVSCTVKFCYFSNKTFQNSSTELNVTLQRIITFGGVTAVPALWQWQSSLSQPGDVTCRTPSNECDHPLFASRCFQLDIIFIWLNSKLLGFSNNVFTFKEWWLLSKRIGKVREYNIGFWTCKDVFQRRPQLEQYRPSWGRTPPWPFSGSAPTLLVPGCRYVGLDVRSLPKVRNSIRAIMSHVPTLPHVHFLITVGCFSQPSIKAREKAHSRNSTVDLEDPQMALIT